MTAQNDKPKLFIVDGSNVATEGRSQPSLEQLNDAVAAFRDGYPDVKVTVVVDATFGHRIAKKEVKAFDKAIAANELVTPPAGAVGRGDAFILAIADKANAGVFSNDSFQEFHGEYEWLFEPGRLIGGKPVPHVGWVFVDRNPVRGRKSRESIKAAKPEPVEGSPTDAKDKAQRRVRKKRADGDDGAGSTARPTAKSTPKSTPKVSQDATDEATDDRTEIETAPDAAAATTGESTGRSATVTARSQINDPGAFFDFVEHHPAGSWVKGVVENYASHGAYARVGDVLVYIPLRLMAEPAPASARKLLKLGDEIDLVIVAFVGDRLSIDAALPAMVPAKVPAAEQPAPKKVAKSNAGRKRKAEPKQPAPEPAAAEPSGANARTNKRAAKKRAAKAPASKAAAKQQAAARKPPAKRSAGTAPAPKKPAASGRASKKKAAAKRGARESRA